MLEIDLGSPEPIFEQIISQIGSAIKNKELLPGDKLPSIRQIAKDLEINPNTVAKAYIALEESQIILTKGRSGSFIAKDASTNYELWLERMIQKELSTCWYKLQSLAGEKKLASKIWKSALKSTHRD